MNKRYTGKKAGNKTKGSKERHLVFRLPGESEESVVKLIQLEADAYWDSESQRAVMLPLYHNTQVGTLRECGKDTD